MLVSFNPMINTGASADAAMMNFFRCVRAICTAAAGTSSITVNPFTNNTGTIDGTRNCIVQIYANAEAGGWTESASSNVVQSGAFTSLNSASFGTYKFDAYNSSGKGALPYYKLCFTTQTAYAGPDGNFQTSYTCSYVGNSGGSYTPLMTFGASTTTDWTDSNFPPGGSTGSNQPNSQTNSFAMNAGHAYNSTSFYTYSKFNITNADRILYMSVTAYYCILWEQPLTSNYISGYANQLSSNPPSNSYDGLPNFGSIMYGGLRETQIWENSLSYNPPWVCLQYTFQRYGTTTNSSSSQGPGNNSIAAYMASYKDNGILNSTAQRYYLGNQFQATSPIYYFDAQSYVYSTYAWGWGPQNPGGGLLPPFVTRSWAQPGQMGTNNTAAYTNQFYMPIVDPVTGTGVPPAFPIVVRRPTSNSWNPGGAIRGLYRSLAMPYTSMQNYFAPGQTYNIYNPISQVTETYMPIVFNEDMFLVRYA